METMVPDADVNTFPVPVATAELGLSRRGALQERIGALGRAHEFVRPHSEESRPQAIDVTLGNLLSSILSAYPAMSDGRLTISGGDFPIHDRAATPVALVFHELATNSLKYGALSSDDGRVAIAISQEAAIIRMIWTERDGPKSNARPSFRASDRNSPSWRSSSNWAVRSRGTGETTACAWK